MNPYVIHSAANVLEQKLKRKTRKLNLSRKKFNEYGHHSMTQTSPPCGEQVTRQQLRLHKRLGGNPMNIRSTVPIPKSRYHKLYQKDYGWLNQRNRFSFHNSLTDRNR